MISMEKQQQLEEVLQDEAFVKSIFEYDTAEEVQSAFAEKGIDLTVDEFNEFADMVNSLTDQQSGELGENELDDIAGGGSKILAQKNFFRTQPRKLSQRLPKMRLT